MTTHNDFQWWLMDMDDALERFLAILPPQVKKKLDFSPSSLSTLEAWILDKYPNTPAMLESDQSRLVDGVARYIGETFRKSLGGRWDIQLDDPKFVYFGVPILTGFEEKPTPICPLTLATASADRRTGKYLRTILENIRNLLSNPS
ncbi:MULTISPECIES: hypothetical protein [unclassified Nostoc]|uniref:hypothetical protein n=1 Tax=unclassified Nostoc TaxID=2593658 RepID=UPI001C11EADD|nr:MULTISPECIES: hypothetical protein [unclassified Nostoc]